MIKSTDFAYAAGYIDGDGCFHIRKQRIKNSHKFMPNLLIASTEEENIIWFKKTFGGQIYTKTKVTEGHKIQHHFAFKRKDIETINNISKYLVEKKQEFIVFDEFHRTRDRQLRENLIHQMNDIKFSTNLILSSIKEDVEALKNTVIPSIEDFAYLAGWIDAECCLNINKSHPKGKPNPTYKILLQCNNTKSPCFYWLSERFGGQFHFIDRSHMKPVHRNQMCWRLSSASLSEILPKIHPFLKHKKPVCEELINFSKTIVPLNGIISRNSPNFGEFYRPILEERERIFHKIQALNKKGV